MKTRVLFICVHNSARSQMAEAWLNNICGEYFEAQSAGLEPGTLNPLAVQVMAEAGIDISKKKTQGVFDVFKSGQLFAYVITVCDETSAEKCPVFPGPATRLHWSFADPSQVEGSEAAKFEQVRIIRDQIRGKIERWCEEICAQAAPPAAV
jgi:arsenate reductase